MRDSHNQIFCGILSTKLTAFAMTLLAVVRALPELLVVDGECVRVVLGVHLVVRPALPIPERSDSGSGQ